MKKPPLAGGLSSEKLFAELFEFVQSGEKFLVAFYRRLALFEYFVGYANGACYAGGVLVDVKASVKMGDTAPFVSYLSVVLHRGTVVFFVEPVVNVGQAFVVERFVRFNQLVRLCLELREHGLTEHGRAYRVQQIT